MSRQPTGMSVHQRLEAASDLSGFVFMSESIYTNIGTNSLVAVNPHKYVSSNCRLYYRDTSENKSPIDPHIFQLANNAYYHMRRTTQDQSILIRQVTAIDPSVRLAAENQENRRLAIKTILELSVSNPGKKGSKLATQLPAAEFVIESFGNARTLFNPNASRFGKYTELQFTDRGRLSGVKTLDYYLERNRVSSVPSGERNFHIFYYLVAGATQEERQHLHLLDKTHVEPSQHAKTGVRDDDANRFEQLKVALKTIGLSKRHVAQTCQLLAAILHLGNLEFTVDRGRDVDAAVVRNTDVLGIVAEFLGVQAGALEGAMSYKTKLVKKELCTVFLDPDGASDNRDDLAKTLYSLLFAWLNEHINQRLCREDFDTFIGLFDLPGPQNMTSRPNSLDQFCVNFANERMQNFVQRRIFEAHVDEYQNEGISRFVPTVAYFDNAECVRLLQNKPGGLIHIMDDQARRSHKKTDHSMVEAFGKRWGNHSSFKVGAIDRSGFPTFTVNHFNGPVAYSAEGFLDRNLDALNPDFVSLLRGSASGVSDGAEGAGSMNPFVKGLFSGKAIATQAHPKNEDTIVAAQQPVKPMRAPSTRRKGTIKRMPTLRENGGDEQDRDDDDMTASAGSGTPCVAGEFRSALDTLFETLADTQNWYVFCINPNDSQLPNQLEGRSVKGQVRSLGMTEIAKRNANVFEVGMTPEEFCQRYRDPISAVGISEGAPRERVEQTRTALSLRERDIVLGQYKVFLSQAAFHSLEDRIRASDVEEQKRNRIRDAEAEAGLDVRGFGDPYAPYSSPGANNGEESPFVNAFSDPALPLVSNASPFQRGDLYDDEYDERKSFRSEDFDNRSRLTSNRDDSNSNYGTESYAPSRNMFQNADKEGLMVKEALPGEIGDGETTEVLKESSARRRWVGVCWALTWWMPSLFLRWIGRMKREDIRQAWREKLAINFIIWFFCACAVFVIVFLGAIICPTEHVFSTSELSSHSYTAAPNNVYTSVRGEVFDLTTVAATHLRVVSVVPVKTILQTYGGTASDKIFPVQVSALCNGVSGSVSPYVTLSSANDTDPNASYHDFRAFTNDSRPDCTMANSGYSLGIYNGMIYDLTTYVNYGPAVQAPSGQQLPGGIDDQFMDTSVVDLFKINSGQDLTKQFDSLNLDSATLDRQRTCLRNLFLIGMVDNRNSPQCQFAEGILLALSILMVAIIGFKFIASINFASPQGETSLRKTIDSLAQLKYDDKRKLILVICDGNIVGSGNDRPTPRIVLDILGADPNLDPEPLSFVSLGEGARQHNMGKVYSGLYECAGHVVPYLVVVKMGKPSERSRPGNRGKRDSQMVNYAFLEQATQVHFSTPMNPLELEMYHQIKNVIGVNPTFFEYLFTVDADTTVEPYSVNRLISACIHDKKVLGVCGETELANAKQSIITMMQVYEYFISHHMAKAFESLFGSVTCLPGCFTLYRLRTPDTHKPLLISNQMVQDYSQNRVDTLHMKNLLHLGEDRYLTTLLLKHFPLHKTQFVRDAHAFTVAPDDWKILLSQRRRWINSTVHNLGELMFLEQLCGFCCFSMRFVVMIDLVSTIIQPITVGYIVYLIVEVATKQETLPVISLVMIGAVYGLQALVFILRRKWDMVGWMVFYILAIPIFSLMLPLYSFWRMDDFSWGATRVVLGESGKKMIIHDEGKFDPRAIPLKSWNDYENELWDKESNHSIGSWIPPNQFHKEGYVASATASLYGRETYYEPRNQSPAPSQFGMMPPPGYQSGRNTPMSQLRPMSDAGMLYQPMPSRPPTNYLEMPIPTTRSHEDMDLAPGVPSDAELDHAVHDILRTADLNSVTKREIRRQLEERFGMDLTSRKGTINAAIDRVLLSQA
ncbi:glycosyltransferase family 2 protein [Suillus lakei]|nr:glycosyltransferase family 2 protein [Suillus lakei]